MINLKCIECGQDRQLGRTRCRPCYLKQKIVKFYENYKIKGRYKFNLECKACHIIFKANIKKCILCLDCRKESRKRNVLDKTYVYTYDKQRQKVLHEHRLIAQTLLNRVLLTDEVVHHLDFNSRNNNVNNLIVMHRKFHRVLHSYLEVQLIILEKNSTDNIKWEDIQVSLTLDWLVNNNISFIKVWEL